MHSGWVVNHAQWLPLCECSVVVFVTGPQGPQCSATFSIISPHSYMGWLQRKGSPEMGVSSIKVTANWLRYGEDLRSSDGAATWLRIIVPQNPAVISETDSSHLNPFHYECEPVVLQKVSRRRGNVLHLNISV